MEEIISLMRSINLFSKLSDTAMQEIAAYCRAVVYEEGQVILAQDMPPGDFYVIRQGSARGSTDNKDKEKISLGMLGQGEYFGEMSILHRRAYLGYLL